MTKWVKLISEGEIKSLSCAEIMAINRAMVEHLIIIEDKERRLYVLITNKYVITVSNFKRFIRYFNYRLMQCYERLNKFKKKTVKREQSVESTRNVKVRSNQEDNEQNDIELNESFNDVHTEFKDVKIL